MSNDSGNTGRILTKAIRKFKTNWEKLPHREDSRTFQRDRLEHGQIENSNNICISAVFYAAIKFFMHFIKF